MFHSDDPFMLKGTQRRTALQGPWRGNEMWPPNVTLLSLFST